MPVEYSPRRKVESSSRTNKFKWRVRWGVGWSQIQKANTARRARAESLKVSRGTGRRNATGGIGDDFSHRRLG